ncbi:hypothetical protein SCG7086_AF_00270 [Chlamydiales bacterium SCGC AG-110-P3]|nr:hypothetical protein SCG7086_AF_00270 [Chlamydiales bacterium SCGC AG-110-P3]
MPTILRAILRTGLVIILLMTAATATLPWILSADWVRQRFLQAVNNQIAGSIEIEKISLSWLSGQQMTGIIVRDPEGVIVVEVPSLTAETSVWSLLSSNPSLGHIELQSPKVSIVEQTEGITTLQLAFGVISKGHETLTDSSHTVKIEPPILDQAQDTPSDPNALVKEHGPHHPAPLFGSFSLIDGDIKVTRADGSIYRLHQITLSVALEGTSDLPTHLIFEFQCKGLSERSKQGTVVLAGEITNITDRNGHLSSDQVDLKATATLTDVRVMELIALLRLPADQQEKVAAIVGNTLNLAAKTTYSQGVTTLILDYQGDNSTASGSAVHTGGVLKLSKDIVATMTVNPTLSRLVLKDINPLLLTAVRAERPIHVRVQAEGFAIPTNPISLATVTIPRATLDFGKVTLTNGGTVQEILSLLQAQDVTVNSEMNTWLTPQHTALDKGSVTISRMDILLADKFHLATWGGVNLIKDRMKFTIGLTSQALKKAFGLKHIQPDQWLQIEVKGSPSKPKVDTGKALVQIGQLLGQESTGDIGELIGELLQATGSDPLNRKVPPPTQQPFPWESDQALMKTLAQPGDPVAPSQKVQKKPDPVKNTEDYLKKKGKEFLKRL